MLSQHEPSMANPPLSTDAVHLFNPSTCSYIICDSAPALGYPIRHASQGFQDLFQCDVANCLGEGFGAQLLKASMQGSQELKTLAKSCGLAESDVHQSLKRMAHSVDAAAKANALSSSVVLAAKKTGELFTCEISWSKNTHPELGWSYHAALLRARNDVSMGEVLKAAAKSTESSNYEELQRDWTSSGAGSLAEKLHGFSANMHAVAEKMWKEELAKETKPSGSKMKRRPEDTSSIWSRSTASTTTSHSAVQMPMGSHHLGALLGVLPRKDGEVEKESNGKSKLPWRCFKSTSAESFWSAPDTIDDFAECETMSHDSNISDASSSPLFNEVEDPVKHVDRSGLRNMKTPFAIASASEGFPIALRSVGFEEMDIGPFLKVRLGADAREVLSPTSDSDKQIWKAFCASVSKSHFFRNEKTCSGVAMLRTLELSLPAGEVAFVQSVHGKLGNPIDCLVYVKHVELDDCPYLLCLHSPLPSDAKNMEEHFYRSHSQVDGVINELASEFFYHAAMHRQKHVLDAP